MKLFTRMTAFPVLFVLCFQSVFGAPMLIRGALVVDGTGRKAVRADVRVVGDTITDIGRLRARKGEEVINARGLVLAPGFIDIHNHSERGLLEEGSAASQVSQGITTIMVGPDGGSPLPIGLYLSSLDGRIAPNAGAFIGHATLRQKVMAGGFSRQATPDEIRRMAALAERAMMEGAFGLSSGLEYDVGYSASTEELIALARSVGKFGGIYMTHMRDEEDGLLDAIREAARIGLEAGVPVQISHIKAGNRFVWGKSVDAVALIEGFRNKGQDITADAYPYTAWASTITVLVPSRRHEDRDEVARSLDKVGGADKVLVTSCEAHRDYEGKTLQQIAEAQNVSPVDVYIEIVKDGGAGVVCNSMSEEDVRRFYTQEWVMVASDGGIGMRHPRGAGTFTKVLGRFVRQDGWLSLEEAVRKMSFAPARRLGLKDRGMIAKGMKADLVLFDPEAVNDRSTFSSPFEISEGIIAVMVNGRRVWDKNKVTGELPGSVLRKR
jgi:N-acyl-D-amino-acid deacylase